MRVVLVTARFAPDTGGVETHVLRLASELARAGHTVTVATSSPPGRPTVERVEVGAGVSFEVRRAHRSARQHPELPAAGLRRLVRELATDADVVHAHSYHALAALVAASATGRTPVVLTLHYHGTGHTRLRSLLHRVYAPVGRWLVRRAAAVIAVSEAEAALLVRDFSAQLARPPIVIPNGTDPLPAATPFPVDVPVVLSVCRLEPYKHVDTLIAARRADTTTPWRLVVVGDGPDRDRLTALAAGDDRIEFRGRVSDDELARWWATASVLGSASHEEAFGLTVAQALAAGVPCVASSIASHRELCAGTTGRLVDGDDPAQWAAAIAAALTTAPDPVPMADWAAVARRTTAVYTEVTS